MHAFQLIQMIMIKVKGIVPLKKIFRLNLIFWIVMGCGLAGFGRRGLKLKVLVLSFVPMGPRGVPQLRPPGAPL